jgi:hypothetical protein
MTSYVILFITYTIAIKHSHMFNKKSAASLRSPVA